MTLRSISAFRTCLAALVSILFLVSSSAASAENGVMPGVKHMALIIANEDYDGDGKIKAKPTDRPSPGMLKDLENPCRDARMIRDRLLASRWRPEEIVFRCNSMTSTMRQLITDFREKLANSSDTVAVFFYSGHGAQFSDAETSHSFLFGTKARIDLDAMAASLRTTHKNTSLIANQALDLDELVGNLGLQTENAVLVILDACRNNPLYGDISELDEAPPVGPLTSNVKFRGVVVAYSTTPGGFSSDGPGTHSPYSSAWASLIQPERTIDDILNNLDAALIAHYRAVGTAGTPSQISESTGHTSGTWCIWACPRRAEPNPVTRGAAAAAAVPGLSLGSYRGGSLAVLKASYTVSQEGEPRPRSGRPGPVPMVLTSPVSTRVVFDVQSHAGASALRPASPMRFDVFWCDGGAGTDDRQTRASAIAEWLGRFAEGRLGGVLREAQPGVDPKEQVITSVRVRRLSPGANVNEGYRYSDDVAVYDVDDARELAWTKLVSQAAAGGIAARADPGRTPGYMSVFVCRAPRMSAAPTLAYLQVPTDDQKVPARLLMKEVARKVPSLTVISGVETRADGPLKTEIRFYGDEDRDTVFDTAAQLETVLGREVRIQYMPRLLDPAARGYIEVWLGRDDPPLPTTGSQTTTSAGKTAGLAAVPLASR
uniref:caspase family protein n=1 Tax=uncultured Sphingomonas sp. TaxID=158754 RepID=UPI0035CAA544